MIDPPSICPEMASARGVKIKRMLRPKKQNKSETKGIRWPLQVNERRIVLPASALKWHRREGLRLKEFAGHKKQNKSETRIERN